MKLIVIVWSNCLVVISLSSAVFSALRNLTVLWYSVFVVSTQLHIITV